ncbi:acyl-CoA synthetase (AMP-forming)/AMP-acid ligase II [Archangium gephyra]|uniref:Acyl-CoA synthetase (AMP-forming)/AMP-acid ligase II n=1 Tax=Archangium gephyra TaxID=48 RepID=A0AAC8QHN9_9BACT|nr:fatty acyl-AMP ligase [Archangium gephyra]AKJ07691.1 Pyoverdine chromophore precursor synthetase PvdL [Archangium gephyra]REG29446.1 acyl-CoA synthetase (AMP-forming)/AMP-acid ligase II [Archangium gephyra]
MKGPALPALKHATLNEALAAAARTPLGLVFVDAGERETLLTWAQVYGRARRFAAGLRRLGVAPGERVALLLPTSPGFMDAFFGALLAGAVPVPLYPPVRLGRLEEYHRSTARMLEVSAAAVVLTDAKVRLLLGASVAAARPRLGCHTVEEVSREDGDLAERVSPESLALIQFSSGSTVDPKPVGLRQGHLMAQLAALEAELPPPVDRAPVGVCWLPLYHDMGLIGCLLSAVYYPGGMVLIPPEVFLARPALWLRALSRHRGFVSPAPNFAYGLCLKRVKDADLEGVDLSGWTHALNGAEPVSVETLRLFSERFSRWGFQAGSLRPVYGLSEASLAVTFPPAGRGPRALGVDARVLATERRVVEGAREVVSVGRPVPGFEVQVRDELGHVLEERRVGRVFARGPSVMAGYVGHPEATARALDAEGWLDTGDLGFEADGELFLTGRAKDLVIIRGANHAPQEFEECLEAVEGLRTGCAVALGFTPEGENDEALLVLAEHAPGAGAAGLEERIREAVLAGTGVKAHTVRVLEPGTLPRTSSGKLRRSEALRRYLAGELTAPRKVGTVGLVVEMAKSALAFARSGRDE